MNEALIKVIRNSAFYAPLRWVADMAALAYWSPFHLIARRLARYQAQHPVLKLQIGCGKNALEGWFNTDLVPSRSRAKLDATKQFPYPDDTFDFVFSEHMIEHLLFDQGQAMLRECLRVLKPGGVLRIVTPDAAFLIKLYVNPDTAQHKHYIEAVSKSRLRHGEPPNPTSVINSYYRDWGHLYIYDPPTMHDALAKTGFSDIYQGEVSESKHPELRGLEHVDRMKPGFLALESMVFEARKPERQLIP
jgi:predicted SAM-dependent methyltransferase